MDRKVNNLDKRQLTAVLGLAVVLAVLVLVSHDAIKCVSARYLPTRSDQSDVDILKALIHEILLRPDVDRSELERSLYARQHPGRMLTSQQQQPHPAELILVQRRTPIEPGSSSGNAIDSPSFARQIYSSSSAHSNEPTETAVDR